MWISWSKVGMLSEKAAQQLQSRVEFMLILGINFPEISCWNFHSIKLYWSSTIYREPNWNLLVSMSLNFPDFPPILGIQIIIKVRAFQRYAVKLFAVSKTFCGKIKKLTAKPSNWGSQLIVKNTWMHFWLFRIHYQRHLFSSEGYALGMQKSSPQTSFEYQRKMLWKLRLFNCCAGDSRLSVWSWTANRSVESQVKGGNRELLSWHEGRAFMTRFASFVMKFYKLFYGIFGAETRLKLVGIFSCLHKLTLLSQLIELFFCAIFTVTVVDIFQLSLHFN